MNLKILSYNIRFGGLGREHVRLDYVFVPKVFSERVIECDVLSEPKETIAAASDHCPLLSRISW